MTQATAQAPIRAAAAKPFNPARSGWVDLPGLVVAILVALILVTASYGKLATGSPAVVDYVIGIGQIVIALLVLALHSRAITWLGVTLLFSAYLGYASQRWLGGVACGCFGELSVLGLDLTKPWVSFSLDVFGILLGVAMLWRLRRLNGDFFGWVATAGAVLAGVGMAFGSMTSPPPATEFVKKSGGLTPVQQLLALPEMSEVRRFDGPAWLLYLYDPTCHICQEHLPYYEGYQPANPSEPVLLVRTVSMTDLETRVQDPIPIWAWENVPTTVLVRGGVAVNVVGGYDMLLPQRARQQLLFGAADPVGDLFALPLMEDVAQAGPADPAWLIYLYDPTDRASMLRLATIQGYAGAHESDPILRVKALSMEALERFEIERERWPAASMTLLVNAGEVTQRTTGDKQPDPRAERARLTED